MTQVAYLVDGPLAGEMVPIADEPMTPVEVRLYRPHPDFTVETLHSSDAGWVAKLVDNFHIYRIAAGIDPAGAIKDLPTVPYQYHQPEETTDATSEDIPSPEWRRDEESPAPSQLRSL